MNCNCKEDIEAKMLERVQEMYPNLENPKVSLNGYGFIMEGTKLTTKPVVPLQIEYDHTVKSGKNKGQTKRKTDEQSMVASYCPFCGTPIQKEEGES